MSISVDHVTFRYGGGANATEDVLSDLTFQTLENEWVGIVGPSGCGKSTLAKLLVGLELPQEGAVSVFGGSPRSQYSDRKIGVVFQQQALVPWLDVRRNINLPALGVPSTQPASDALLEIASAFKIADHLDHYPDELSGGQMARAALARSLIHGPRFVVWDEPFSALDDITIAAICSYLSAWRERNPCTLILVSHNFDAVARLADRSFCFPRAEGERFVDIDFSRFGAPAFRTNESLADIRKILLDTYL